MKSYAYIDIETNGVDSIFCEIIHFSAMKIYAGKTEYFDKYAKPKNKLTAKTEELVKITNKDLENCESFETVREEFLAFLGDAVIICFNPEFVERFLKTDFPEKGKVILP